MNGQKKTARILVGLGCFVLLTSAALHLAASYPRVSAAITASNLNASLQSVSRAIFLMIGSDWIAIAIITLIGAFTKTTLRKPIVTFCGAVLLVHSAIMLRFMGWFVGTDMILAAGTLILLGGLLFEPVRQPGGVVSSV